jgi:hypothetical protein
MKKPDTRIILTTDKHKFTCYSSKNINIKLDFNPLVETISKSYSTGIIVHFNRLFKLWGIYNIVTGNYTLTKGIIIENNLYHEYFSTPDNVLPSDVLFYPNAKITKFEESLVTISKVK